MIIAQPPFTYLTSKKLQYHIRYFRFRFKSRPKEVTPSIGGVRYQKSSSHTHYIQTYSHNIKRQVERFG